MAAMIPTQVSTPWTERRTPKTDVDIAAVEIIRVHLDLLEAAAERFGSLDAGLDALIALQRGA